MYKILNMMPNSKNSIVDVTVILTGYNEGPILKGNLEEVKNILDETRYKWEIILIDDKSSDNTPKIFKSFADKNSNVKAFFHSENIGRGGTVAEGIKAAKGKIVGFIDTDLELPAIYIPKFVRAIEGGADVAIAARIYTVSFSNLFRTILSTGYTKMVKGLLDLGVKDTEAGLKFFNRKKILPILDQTKDKRWFFDTEIVARSLWGGLKIVEVPVLYLKKPEGQSSVHVIRDTIRYTRSLLHLRRNFPKK